MLSHFAWPPRPVFALWVEVTVTPQLLHFASLPNQPQVHDTDICHQLEQQLGSLGVVAAVTSEGQGGWAWGNPCLIRPHKSR
jgi:hypothetical protein